MSSQSKFLLAQHLLFLSLGSVVGFNSEAFTLTREEVSIDDLMGLLCDIAWTAQ